MSARILIIDDEANIRTMARLTLEHAGYTVETAAEGKEGLEKFGDGSQWDLVLLDQRMPGLTGLEVQQEIVKRKPDARLVMITAFGSIEMALEAMQAGALDFLRKPFSSETLRRTLESALARPAQRMAAVPIGMACKEFTRTTINGFSFELDEREIDEHTNDYLLHFKVTSPSGEATPVLVTLPAYVRELAKAYADIEEAPGGARFWEAMGEEALASALWQNAEVPAGGKMRLEDLTQNLQRWLDQVLTVELSPRIQDV